MSEREQILKETSKQIKTIRSRINRKKRNVGKHLERIQDDLNELNLSLQTLENLNKSKFSYNLSKIFRKKPPIALKEARDLCLMHRRNTIDKIFLQTLGILQQPLKKNPKKLQKPSNIIKMGNIQQQFADLKENEMGQQEKEIALSMVEEMKKFLMK